MKDVIECNSCADCAIERPAGFVSAARHYCIPQRCYVDPDDGCTFGTEGAPRHGCPDVSVCIDSRAAVNGYPLPE